MFTFEATAIGPNGRRDFTFTTEGFDATAIVEVEAQKHLRDGERLHGPINRQVERQGEDGPND